MVCGSEGKFKWNRIDPCGICGKRVTVNSMLCTKCDQWIHERKVASAARFFVCSKCAKATNGAGELQQEIMCDRMETVKRFCNLGDRL